MITTGSTRSEWESCSGDADSTLTSSSSEARGLDAIGADDTTGNGADLSADVGAGVPGMAKGEGIGGGGGLRSSMEAFVSGAVCVSI